MHISAPSASRQPTKSRFGRSSLGHVFAAGGTQPPRNNSFGTMRTVSIGSISSGSNESDDGSDVYEPSPPRRASSSVRLKRRSFFSFSMVAEDDDDDDDGASATPHELRRSASMPGGSEPLMRTSSFDAIGQMFSAGFGLVSGRPKTFGETESKARAAQLASDFELSEHKPVELNRTASFGRCSSSSTGAASSRQLERRMTFDESAVSKSLAPPLANDFELWQDKPLEMNRTPSFRRQKFDKEVAALRAAQMADEFELSEERPIELNRTGSFGQHNRARMSCGVERSKPTIITHTTTAHHYAGQAAVSKARAAELADRYELSENKPIELNRTASFGRKATDYTGPAAFSGGKMSLTPKQAAEKFNNKFGKPKPARKTQLDPLLLKHEQEKRNKTGVRREKERDHKISVLSTRTPLRRTQSYPAPSTTTTTTYQVGPRGSIRRMEPDPDVAFEEEVELEMSPSFGASLGGGVRNAQLSRSSLFKRNSRAQCHAAKNRVYEASGMC